MTSLTSSLWASYTNHADPALQFVLKTKNLMLVSEMKSHRLCLCLVLNCYSLISRTKPWWNVCFSLNRLSATELKLAASLGWMNVVLLCTLVRCY